ncbi:Uncharacterised protein [Mycobacterium tuberculosis]|nr:Uncharacterised protein [Mycobacterium tuberculosis]
MMAAPLGCTLARSRSAVGIEDATTAAHYL